MSEELDWINSFYHSYISEDSIQSLYNFVLFWSMFESLVFCDNNNGVARVTAQAICDKIDALNEREAFTLQQYETALRYFKNRYIHHNSPTQHFINFIFRPNDKKKYVEAVLKADMPSSIDVVKVLLIIVYRLRNNLFHGLKEVPRIYEQEENFRHANMVIKSFLEDYKRRTP